MCMGLSSPIAYELTGGPTQNEHRRGRQTLEKLPGGPLLAYRVPRNTVKPKTRDQREAERIPDGPALELTAPLVSAVGPAPDEPLEQSVVPAKRTPALIDHDSRTQ